MSQVIIYSKFGVLIASPMECVDLEKSIQVGTNAQNQVDQGAPAVSEETEGPSAETSD